MSLSRKQKRRTKMCKIVKQFFGVLPRMIRYAPKLRKMAKHIDDYSIEERFALSQSFMYSANKAVHIVPYISGQENLPKGQVLFTPNHSSGSDPVSLIMISDRPIAFVSKKEVKKVPVISKAIESCGGKYIDRSDLRSEIKLFKEIDKEMDKFPTLSYVIFPEGTRAKAPDFNVGEFHAGSFKLATRRNIPICPIAIFFSRRVFSGKYHYKKYPVQYRYLKPLYPEEYQNLTTAEISQIVRDEIIEALKDMKIKDREYVKECNNFSDKKLDKVFFVYEKPKKKKHSKSDNK